jgi:hypothetical protein
VKKYTIYAKEARPHAFGILLSSVAIDSKNLVGAANYPRGSFLTPLLGERFLAR